MMKIFTKPHRAYGFCPIEHNVSEEIFFLVFFVSVATNENAQCAYNYRTDRRLRLFKKSFYRSFVNISAIV